MFDAVHVPFKSHTLNLSFFLSRLDLPQECDAKTKSQTVVLTRTRLSVKLPELRETSFAEVVFQDQPIAANLYRDFT